MNHVIIGIELDASWSSEDIEKYILSDLVKQTSKAYKCFIEYPKEMKKKISLLEAKWAISKEHIYFVPDEVRKVNTTFEKRLLVTRMNEYVASLVPQYDPLLFMHYMKGVTFSNNLVQFLNEYTIQKEEKLIRFKEGYVYRNNKVERDKEYVNHLSYAFITTPNEFVKLFMPYTLVYGLGITPLQRFPARWVSNVPYIRS